ncbi:hypothetical protein WUBG_07849, partial [Wuchereria bancrofti]
MLVYVFGMCVYVCVCLSVFSCYCIVPTVGSFNLNRRYTVGWWDVVLVKWCPQITELSCRVGYQNSGKRIQ